MNSATLVVLAATFTLLMLLWALAALLGELDWMLGLSYAATWIAIAGHAWLERAPHYSPSPRRRER